MQQFDVKILILAIWLKISKLCLIQNISGPVLKSNKCLASVEISYMPANPDGEWELWTLQNKPW